MNKQITKKVVATFTSVATVAMLTAGAFLPMGAGAVSTIPLVGSLTLTPEVGLNLEIEGTLAYVAEIAGEYPFGTPSKIKVVDISNPSSPVVAQSIDTPISFEEMAVKNGVIYAGGYATTDLYVMDTGATTPTFTQFGSCGTTLLPAVSLSGNILVVVCSSGTSDSGAIKFFDISSPANPTLVHTMTPGLVTTIALRGNTLYSSSYYGVTAYDISNPSAPVTTGHVALPAGANVPYINVSGNLLFMYQDNSSGYLRIADITDTQPNIDNEYPVLSGMTADVGYDNAVSGDMIFINTYAYPTHTVKAYYAADPSYPIITAATPPSPYVHDIKVSGSYLYTITATSASGSSLYIYNILGANQTPTPTPTETPTPTPTPTETPTPQDPATCNGNLLASWTTSGPGTYVSGLAVDRVNKFVYVNRGGVEIQKYDLNGTLQTSWTAATTTGRGLAVDSAGNVYFVGGSNGNMVSKFDGNGTPVNSFAGGTSNNITGFSTAFDVAVDPSGNIYVAEYGTNSVKKFDASGNPIGSPWSIAGSPTAVAVDPTGAYVYVANNSTRRVEKYDSSGTLLTQWGSFGSGPGQFWASMFGLAVNPQGDVYVVERGFASAGAYPRVQKFDPNGTFLYQWTGLNSGVFGIDADAANKIYVADGFTQTVKKYGCVDIPGCMDPEASNYNPAATVDDGSCVYPTPTATPTPVLTPFTCTATSIVSNFNGTPIAEGRTIWFNSVIKPKLPAAVKTTISFTDQTVSFTANNVNYTLPIPDSRVTYYDSSVTQPTTTFNTATNTWEIRLPKGPPSGNTFLSGMAFPVPAGGLPGGINPVTWSGNMHSDKAKVTAQWKWAAAVYTAFSTDYNAVGVKPTDAKTLQYANADLAGTPENFKKGAIGTVTGGARGGGGSNYTGSYSGTKSVTMCQQVYEYPRIPVLPSVSASSVGNLLALAAAALAAGLGIGVYARRR